MAVAAMRMTELLQVGCVVMMSHEWMVRMAMVRLVVSLAVRARGESVVRMAVLVVEGVCRFRFPHEGGADWAVDWTMRRIDEDPGARRVGRMEPTVTSRVVPSVCLIDSTDPAVTQ